MIDLGIFAGHLGEVTKGAVQDSELRNTLIKHFNVEGEENAGYKAAAIEAVECSVSICNMFLAIRGADTPRTLRMLADLTIGLNTNQFWVRNAPSIVPMIQAAIFDYFDEAALTLEKTTNKSYVLFDGLIAHSKCNPLAIVSYMLFLLGGPKLSMAKSLLLKQDLYALFNR